MTEYIEREKLPQEVSADGMSDTAVAFAAGYNTCLEHVKSIPTADVRPVVLCRDCKYYRQSNFVDKHMECVRIGVPVHSVDFCSRGEKREESL